MKSIKNKALLLIAVLCLGLTSCMKDVGNKTSSYGIGTVFSDGYRQYIQLDPEWGYGIRVSSDNISALGLTSGQRVFLSYSIDFDNQPASGQLSPGVYWATIELSSTPVIKEDLNILPAAYDYIMESDTLLQIASPYITSFTDPNQGDNILSYLTIQTLFNDNQKTGEDYSMNFYRKSDYVPGSQKDTIYVDFHKGDVDAAKPSLSPFFTVPIYGGYGNDDNVEVVVYFKATNALFSYETKEIKVGEDQKPVMQKFVRCTYRKPSGN